MYFLSLLEFLGKELMNIKNVCKKEEPNPKLPVKVCLQNVSFICGSKV